MGDRDERPTVVERPRSDAPKGELGQARTDIDAGAAPPSVTSAFDPPDDRFETRGELGRGGMGRVDEAYDRALGRPVAIKHMLQVSGPELVRFEREARITARLEHPGIVPIHDAGRAADGTPYYVMRRIDGRPLSDLVRGKSLDERLALVPDVLAACDAAGYAHARGVVHRDIKPSNILIGPFGETLLIDWGLAREVSSDDAGGEARVRDPELTRAGTIAGTPGFMSPEQSRGEAVDARTDVFALGVTLFYVLSGQLPWQGTGSTEIIDAVGKGTAPQWGALPPEVPADLRAVVKKAIAREPADRYPDAGALAADLRRFITGNLVGAYSYGHFARLVRFARRHRAAFGVGIVSFLILAVVGIVSVRRVIAERDDARAARALAEQRQLETRAMADGLLVQSAQQLADTDPLAAIAQLRRLPADSVRWPEAWAAATSAWLKGVPFGFKIDSEPTHIEIAGDSRHALVATAYTGTISVIDLSSRERRQVATVGRVRRLAWLEPGKRIVVALHQGTIVLDVATGDQRALAMPPIETLVGDRKGRVLAFGEGSVYEITASAPEPRLIANDVRHMSASKDLTIEVYDRGPSHDLEVRHGGRVLQLPWSRKRAPVIDARDSAVLLNDEGTVSYWAITDRGLVQELTADNPGFLVANLAGGYAYAVDAEGIIIFTQHGRRTTMPGTFGIVFPTPRGLLVTADDGSLVVLDELGPYRIGRRPNAYSRVDHSPDGRFVVAVASQGDLLVWDLAGIRPRQVNLVKSDLPLMVSASNVWTYQVGEGIARTDLETGEREVVVSSIRLESRVHVDPRERWLAVTDSRGIHILDFTTDTTHSIKGSVANIAIGNDDIAFANAAGEVYRWRPGDPRADTPQLQLPEAPVALALRGEFLVAVVGVLDIIRVHLPTRSIERSTLPTPTIAMRVEPSGRTWFLSEPGAVYRWKLAGPEPELIELAEPIDAMIDTSRGMLLRGANAIVEIGDGGQRVLAVTSRDFSWMNDDLVAIGNAQGAVAVLDLTTGKRVELPFQAARARGLIGEGMRVGTIRLHANQFAFLDLDVPREPAALARWLDEITNARSIEGSDAIAWP